MQCLHSIKISEVIVFFLASINLIFLIFSNIYLIEESVIPILLIYNSFIFNSSLLLTKANIPSSFIFILLERDKIEI